MTVLAGLAPWAAIGGIIVALLAIILDLLNHQLPPDPPYEQPSHVRSVPRPVDWQQDAYGRWWEGEE